MLPFKKKKKRKKEMSMTSEKSQKMKLIYLFVLAFFLLPQSRNQEIEDIAQEIPRKVCGPATDKVKKLWQSFTYSVPQQCQREQR